MSGLFGSFLELSNQIGGSVLSVLIGEPAWRQGVSARLWRLIFGGFSLGALIGVLGFVILTIVRVSSADPKIIEVTAAIVTPCCMAPAVLFIFVLFLEGLRHLIGTRGEK